MNNKEVLIQDEIKNLYDKIEFKNKEDFEYSYKLSYDYHNHYCEQRTSCFNFYIVISLAVLGFQCNLFDNDSKSVMFSILLLIFPIFEFFVSFWFFKMDQRTKHFLDVIRKLIIKYEDINKDNSMNKLFIIENEVRNIPHNNKIFKKNKSLTNAYNAFFIAVPFLSMIISIIIFVSSLTNK